MAFRLPQNDLSISWTDYSANISIAFNDLLKHNALVDVTLVAEDYMFNAHRLVLSALSPYFRRIFTQMPANQQAFVFLTGVSKQSLADLLQYIYNGKVNIKEDNLETFLRTAEAFGINGFEKNQLNFGKSSTSMRFESNRPPNTSQYQSIGINKRKLAAHSDHQNKDNVRAPKWVPYQHVEPDGADDPFNMPESDHNAQSLIDNNQLHISLEDLKVFDVRNTQLPNIKGEKHVEQIERNGNKGSLMAKHMDQPEDRNGGNNEQPAAKRLKRTKKIDFAEFNIVADIRKDADGRENVYHQNRKFCRHDKASTTVSSRWVCTKNRSERCRAIIKTVDVDGVTMMCVVRAEHTH